MTTERYDQTFACHYSAYRPPLHKIILEYVLTERDFFQNGLDIGCGTGYSAVALAEYCKHVYGIDPSESMLKQAPRHEKITYVKGKGDLLFLQNNTIDIVTFAGSLFYAKSLFLTQELRRVRKDKCLIIPYDFEILFYDILDTCALIIEKTKSNYNHKINFSEEKEFNEIIVGNKQIEIETTSINLAHLLLSNSNIYTAFVEKYKKNEPFPYLVENLETIGNKHKLKVDIYYSKYRL